MASLETDFSGAPYYNDYDEDKNFHRVLFRPGVALQARELTQLQDYLQDQIQRYGNFTFKDGSIVKGCEFTFDSSVGYIKFGDLNFAGQPLNISAVNTSANVVAYEPNKQISAYVVDGIEGLESQNPDLKTIFVKYRGSSGRVNNANTVFASTDKIYFINNDKTSANLTITDVAGTFGVGNTIYQTKTGATGTITAIDTSGDDDVLTITLSSGLFTNTHPIRQVGASTITANVFTIDSSYLIEVANVASNATFGSASDVRKNTVGTSFRMTVADGIIFQKGHFIRTDKQSIIVEKYTQYPIDSYIGFYTNEQLINSNSDSTLLDTASGFNNENAPGANRLKLTPTLVNLNATAYAANSQFFPLVGYANGVQIVNNQDVALNKLNDVFARRTREESGDYVVDKFQFNTRVKTGNTDYIDLIADPGIAYVDGYRVQSTDNRYIAIRKGLDENSLNNQSIFTNFQRTVYINDIQGHFDFKAGDTLGLSNTNINGLSGDTNLTNGISGSYSINTIGTAKIRSVEKVSGTLGTPSGVMKLYLFDISMNEGQSFSNITSVYQGSGPSSYTAFGDVVTTDNGKVVRGSTQAGLVFNTGSIGVKTITDVSKITRTHDTIQFTASGSSADLAVTNNDILPYSAGDPSPNRNDFIVVPQTSFRRTDTLTGTVATQSNNTLAGTSTSFTSELTVGQYIYVSGEDKIFRVTRIDSDSSIEVTPAAAGSSSSLTFNYAFPKDIAIDLEAFNDIITVTVGSNSNTVTFDVGGAANVTSVCDISFNKKITTASVKSKTINKDRWVYIDISSDKTGPWTLSVSDVHKINAVYGSSSGTSISGATNLTTSFTLDNGQNKDYYGLARLLKKSSSSVDLTSYNYLVVQMEYYTHGTGDFFCVSSYQVDDTTDPLPSDKIRTEDIEVFKDSSGNLFDLRNCIDFRPKADNKASPGANTASAAAAGTSTITFTGSDLGFPAPNDRFDYDITHYLPRKDIVTVDSIGQIEVVEGVSEFDPKKPVVQSGVLPIAEVSVPVFPSLSAAAAKTANREDYLVKVKSTQPKRYTMKDIGQLDQRIKNLEYYTSLNALERQAKEIVIPSEANAAVERFKSGIFVDGFNDLLGMDTNSEELRVIPGYPQKSAIAPNVDNYTIRMIANTAASSGVNIGEDVSLDYTHKALISQDYASRTRNLLEDVYHFEGIAAVFPNFDVYYDENVTPVNINVDLATPFAALIDLFDDIGIPTNWSTTEITENFLGQFTETNAAGATRIVEDYNVINTTVENNIAVSSVEDLVQVGDYVRDVKLNPYIKDREVLIYVTGLRPGSYHRVYFDDTDVTQYCVPTRMVGATLDRYVNYSTASTYITSTWENNRSKFTNIGVRGTYQSALALATGSTRPAGFEADSDGTLLINFKIPSATFFVGNHIIAVSDATTYSSLDSSISIGYGEYNAYNYTVGKDALSLTTTNPTIEKVTNETTVSSTERVNGQWSTPPVIDIPSLDFSSLDWTNLGLVSPFGGCIPLTQTLFIAPELCGNRDGFFLSKIDLYFATKSDKGGVKIYLKTVENGTPTAFKIPGSEVSVKSSDVTTSATGTAATSFVFANPIYVRANQEYAVIIHPEDGSPDWQAYTYKVGAEDLATGQRNVANFNAGNMFLSTNARNFAPVNDEDVKIKFYRADFGTSATGTSVFYNDNYEFFDLENVSGSFTVGESVVVLPGAETGTVAVSSKKSRITSDYLVEIMTEAIAGNITTDIHGNVINSTYNLNGGGSVALNDVLTILQLKEGDITVSTLASTNSTFVKFLRENFYVTDIDGLDGDYVYGTSTNFSNLAEGDVIVVKDANNDYQENYVASWAQANSTVIKVKDGWRLANTTSGYDRLSGLNWYADHTGNIDGLLHGIVINYNSSQATMIINKSNAANSTFKFANGQQIRGMESDATANVSVVDKSISYSQLLNNKITVPDSTMTATITINNGAATSKTVSFPYGSTKYFETAASIMSRSNEITNNAGVKSLKLTYSLSSGSSFSSPLLNKQLSVNCFRNKIQSTVTGETGRTGTSTSKYVSRIIELKDGLDAEDIRVFIDAYKPANTYIDVYAKIISDTDTEEFIDKDWTLLSYTDETSNVRSSSANKFDVKEFELTFSTTPPNTTASGAGTVSSGNTVITNIANTSEFSVGDVILINDTGDSDYFVTTVTAVETSNSEITVANEITYTADGNKTIRVVSQPKAAFKYSKNDSIVRYFDGGLVPQDSYKKFAIKIVMRADNHYLVPRVENLRAIAVSV